MPHSKKIDHSNQLRDDLTFAICGSKRTINVPEIEDGPDIDELDKDDNGEDEDKEDDEEEPEVEADSDLHPDEVEGLFKAIDKLRTTLRTHDRRKYMQLQPAFSRLEKEMHILSEKLKDHPRIASNKSPDLHQIEQMVMGFATVSKQRRGSTIFVHAIAYDTAMVDKVYQKLLEIGAKVTKSVDGRSLTIRVQAVATGSFRQAVADMLRLVATETTNSPSAVIAALSNASRVLTAGPKKSITANTAALNSLQVTVLATINSSKDKSEKVSI